MKLEWDADKAARNLEKHGVTFEDADQQARLDAEVLDFFKHMGKRYQSRINAVLRSYVEAHKAHAK